MCGIAGMVSREGIDARILAEMGRVLAHRGPDGAGFLSWAPSEGPVLSNEPALCAGKPVALLHRRLSILDLSKAGHQPMVSHDGRYSIVFNGEIYNYKELRSELAAKGYIFTSRSDTEVLLAAYVEWGWQALDRLVGMFAFAVIDMHEQKLFLARDPFGMKPLYYTWLQDGGLAFASEIKALLCIPGVGASAHPGRVYEYLRLGATDQGGATMFCGIDQLPAAHYLTFDLSSPVSSPAVRYWRLSLPAEPLGLSFGEAAEQLREMFLKSIRLHLRSDVPVGFALSGGIDSSSTAMAVRKMRGLDHELRLHAFSYIAGDGAPSEEHWIDLVGEAAGAQVHKTRPTAEELVRDLDALIAVQDEPFVSTSIYAQYRVFRLAREVGIKVTLDGQGADEYLGGYPSFAAARLASLFCTGKLGDGIAFLRHSGKNSGLGIQGVLLRALALLAMPYVPNSFNPLGHWATRPQWLNRDYVLDHRIPALRPSVRSGRDVLRERLIEATENTSLPALLRYADRNAMANSVESRLPFLMPEMVQFVVSLPESYIIAADGTSKAVFRQAMRGIVPSDVLDRRDKIGFVTPERHWLVSQADWVESVLGNISADAVPVLNLRYLRKEWQKVLAGHGNPSGLWRAINLIRWVGVRKVAFSA